MFYDERMKGYKINTWPRLDAIRRAKNYVLMMISAAEGSRVEQKGQRAFSHLHFTSKRSQARGKTFALRLSAPFSIKTKILIIFWLERNTRARAGKLARFFAKELIRFCLIKD
jgi:hypothetical protein